MKNNKNPDDLKVFNMRMPKDIWMFLKTYSAANEISMTDIIMGCVEKYKKRIGCFILLGRF